MRAPTQFVLFCIDMLVSRVAGMPFSRTVNAPVMCRAGPITHPDATPVATPALSPFDRGIVVDMLWAGAHSKRIVYAAGTPIGAIAMFGYGMGTTAGPAGVRQTSGNPMSMPII